MKTQLQKKMIRMSIALMALIISCNVMAQKKKSKTLHSVADTYVKLGSPNENHDAEDNLLIKGSKGDAQRIAFIQFDLSVKKLSKVKSAKLRLYGKSPDGIQNLTVIAASNDWAANIGAVKNGSVGTSLGSVKVSDEKKYYVWDVTSYVQEQLKTNAKKITLMLIDLDASGLKSKFGSKEANKKPELVLK
jgi:hypothetical protein